MLRIAPPITIPDSEIEIYSVHTQGAGEQHVNKVSTAVHLRFDIGASSLPPPYKQALLRLRDHRISGNGVITIKSQEHRSHERNREEAVARLLALIQGAIISRKKREPTTPTAASCERRIVNKKRRGQLKSHRKGVEGWRGLLDS
jgi:ribosome-associated protein